LEKGIKEGEEPVAAAVPSKPLNLGKVAPDAEIDAQAFEENVVLSQTSAFSSTKRPQEFARQNAAKSAC
jgi:hypothetical protein